MHLGNMDFTDNKSLPDTVHFELPQAVIVGENKTNSKMANVVNTISINRGILAPQAI